ncbi:MAG: DUF2062 domain-containing protein [Gammaproteobacteria bacterium]|jgi:uncharacterized protein (DUF2062 family)|nr:DUF2062 domain-containing protein [Gammaproteobacteria bacterium]
MPRKILKRWLPDHRTIREHKHLQRFGTRLHDPNLWHLNRRSVPGAVSTGLFVAFIPTPFQMAIAAFFAILFRVNLPISVALVWVTNPLTMPPVFYFCYRLGAWLLDKPVHRIDFSNPSLTWLLTEMKMIWAPVLLGCLVTGAVAAILGNLFIRSFWRLHVNLSWRARQRRELARRRKNARQQEAGQKSGQDSGKNPEHDPR